MIDKNDKNLQHPKGAASQPDGKTALLSGICLLIMTAAAGIAFGGIHSQFSGSASAELVAQTIAAARGLFVLEIVLWLIILATDIIIAVVLFRFYRPAAKTTAAAAMVFRLVYSAILGIAILFLVRALFQLEAGYKHIGLFEKIWSLGLIVFGPHLIFLGSAALRSRFTPKVLGWLLIIAGISYTLIHSLQNAGPEMIVLADRIEGVLSLPMMAAEIGLAGWLVYVGIKARKDRNKVQKKYKNTALI